MGSKYTAELRQKGIELYQKYQNYVKVGKELNVSDEVVRYWCKPELQLKYHQKHQTNPLYSHEYNQRYYKKKMETLRTIPLEYETYLAKKRMHNRKYYPKKKAKYIKKVRIPLTVEQILNSQLGMKLRSRIKQALLYYQATKCCKTEELLGCNINEFRIYLESLFTEGMSWKNYGRHGWHIDHIIPCKYYQLSDPIEQRQCFHFTNCQPMWEKENLQKGCNYKPKALLLSP